MKRPLQKISRFKRIAVLAAFPVAAFVAAPAGFCAEPPKKPPRRAPLERARVDDARPRVTLQKEALRNTLATIVDDSRGISKRVNAIGLAGLARLRAAVPALAKVLKRHDNIEVKVAAVWALREIGDPAAIPVLLYVQGEAVGPKPRLKYKKTISFPDLGVEMTFIELIEDSIGRLGEPVIGKYLEVLRAPGGSYRSQSPKVTNVQRSALAVIVFIGDGDHRAVTAMADILKAPKEAYPPDFRETAAYGLARVLVARTKEFSVVRAKDKVADEITELLSSFVLELESGITREYIASAFNIARPEYVVTLLTRHFADNSPEKVRRRVIEVLGMLRSREAVEALIWALEYEKNPELRWRAAFGLGLSGPSDIAFEALKKGLEDESVAVRRVVLGALARTGGKRSVKLIAPAVRDPDPKVRTAAAKALGMTRASDAVEHLLVMATDKDVIVRSTTIAALAAIPSRKSLAALVKATRDEARPVRFAATKVLSNIRGSAAYEALLGLVGDPDRKIKSEATNALHIAHAQHPEALKKVLIRVITAPDNRASADACDFANFPKDAEIVKTLQRAALDKRPAVRASALRMLHHMGLK